MRIIAGKFKGRRITPPADNKTTRPVTDRVKEAVFSVLRGHFENVVVADLFAGTGSFGLEAVSRGADTCLFVERDKRMLNVLRGNIDHLDAGPQCLVFPGDVFAAAWQARLPEQAHIIFLDPPYALMRDEQSRRRVFNLMSFISRSLAEDGFMVLRTPAKHLPRDMTIANLDGPETRVYGSTAVHFYVRTKDEP